VLTGFVGSDGDLDIVRRAASETPAHAWRRHRRAWPQCETLQTLEKPLAQADQATIDIGRNGTLRDGDILRIEIQPPSQISYLYVSYVQADGSVGPSGPAGRSRPQPTPPGQAMVFGDGQQGRATFS